MVGGCGGEHWFVGVGVVNLCLCEVVVGVGLWLLCHLHVLILLLARMLVLVLQRGRSRDGAGGDGDTVAAATRRHRRRRRHLAGDGGLRSGYRLRVAEVAEAHDELDDLADAAGDEVGLFELGERLDAAFQTAQGLLRGGKMGVGAGFAVDDLGDEDCCGGADGVEGCACVGGGEVRMEGE